MCYHIVVPHTVEEFFQEADCSGRDGLPVSSTVYYNNNDISAARNISMDMVDYVSSGVCKFEYQKKLHSRTCML